MQHRLKLILFLFLFALLWLPIFQEQTKYFREPVLQGAFVKPAMPEFSRDSLNALSFQRKYEDYKNYNFGFRGLMVKLRNSLYYPFFKNPRLDYIAGKNDFIFDVGSVESTLGINYSGKDRNNATIERIKFLKEGVEKNGGHFLAIIAPSKEKIFPDFLPAKYLGKEKIPTNYNDFVEGYTRAGIPFIDFCPYFKKLRETSPYPIYTKTGLHWSMYASSFVLDSLLSYIEKSLSKPLPKYKRNGIELSDTARYSDAEFEFSLNLFYSIGQSEYVYPKLEMIPSTEKNYRPKVIIIGDSYFQQLMHQKMLGHIFSDDSRFWFYFAANSYRVDDNGAGFLLKDAEVMEDLESADYVILIGNLSTLYSFPYGVTDYYHDNTWQPRITDAIKEYMKSNPSWVQTLTQEAKSKNISFDEFSEKGARQIRRDRKVFNLKAANDKYLCADKWHGNMIMANSDNGYAWETFSMLNLDSNHVAIYSHEKKFFSTELGSKTGLTATKDKIDAWETFTISTLDDNFVAFKAINGKYLSLDEKLQQVFANANTIGKNEKFKLIDVK